MGPLDAVQVHQLTSLGFGLLVLRLLDRCPNDVRSSTRARHRQATKIVGSQ